MRRLAYERDPRWRRAMTLVEHVYRLTQGFPAEEKSGLAATLRRGVTATPLRIAAAVEAASEAGAATAWNATHDLLRDLEATLLICRRLRLIGWLELRRLRAAVQDLDDQILDALDTPDDSDTRETSPNLRLTG